MIYIYIYIYIYDAASAQTSQKQDGHNTYVIIKTMFRPSHHQNVFVAH